MAPFLMFTKDSYTLSHICSDMEQEKFDIDKMLEVLRIYRWNGLASPNRDGNVFEALGARSYNPDGTLKDV